MSNLSGILGELQAEGVLRLYHDYRSGSLRDWSGFGNDGTGSGTVWTKLGIGPTSPNGRVTVVDAASNQLATAGCLVGLGNFSVKRDYKIIISKRVSSSVNYQLGIEAAGAYFQDTGGGIRSLSVSPEGKKCIACSFTSGSPVTFYYDGIYQGASATNCSVASTTDPIYIGNLWVNGFGLSSTLRAILVISRPLTATEHQKLYQQLQQMSWPTKPYSRGMKPRYTEANNSGMQFRYSGAKRDGKYLDSSGNGNDSTAAVGTSAGKNGIGMGQSGSYVESPITTATVSTTSARTMSAFIADTYVQTGFTFGAVIGPRNTAGFIHRYGSIYLNLSPNAGILWYNGATYRSSNLVINGRLKHLFSCVFDTVADAAIVYRNGVFQSQLATIDIQAPASPVPYVLGEVSPTATLGSAQGTIGDGTLWNRALTATDVRNEWLQYAQMTQWKSGWGVPESLANESTASTFLGQNNSPYEIISGTWKITTRTVDGRPAKCLECIAAGAAWLDLKDLAINSAEAAYGSWAGRVYHAASATPTILTLTNSAKAVPGSVNGHAVRIYNAESRLSRNAAGTYTDLATVAHTSGAIIDVHAARRFDDVWQLYTKALGEAWATAASATDANYTVSAGMSLSANAGDYLVLGSLTGDHSWTKYLGEFDPREV